MLSGQAAMAKPPVPCVQDTCKAKSLCSPCASSRSPERWCLCTHFAEEAEAWRALRGCPRPPTRKWQRLGTQQQLPELNSGGGKGIPRKILSRVGGSPGGQRTGLQNTLVDSIPLPQAPGRAETPVPPGLVGSDRQVLHGGGLHGGEEEEQENQVSGRT
jgi:hypothetical protein